ncbi:MAG: aldehyde ferredoxin oxidoreductase, partial [Desulfobacterales bacterium]|nr:aldehyde ferredoxin oxidoreductase [Desulfobacterales bacterium]
MALNRKIAHVDLGKREIRVFPVSTERRRKFLGGRGVGASLLYQYASRGCDPLGPDSAMVISAGLLAGTLASPRARVCLMAASPLTGLVSRAFLGGSFAAEMRWAGLDHLVLTGRASHPVYLYIHDGEIEIRNAETLRGLGVFEARASIRKELGDEEIKMLTVGPAGENLARFANVAADRTHAGGRTGMGAALGAKNVKAV